MSVKPRSINYFSEEGVAFTVSAVPAQFKNIDGTQFVVSKRGYINLKWLQYDSEKEEINYAERRDFIVSPNNVDSIIGIDPHRPQLDADGEILHYNDIQTDQTKVMRILALEDGDFNLMCCVLKDESELVDQMEIRLKKG